MLAKLVASPTEHAHRLVTAEEQVPVLHRDIEDVALADAERVAKVGRQHHPPERVDAPSAVLRAHGKRVRPGDMRSVS